jgi:hypothetical protein
MKRPLAAGFSVEVDGVDDRAWHDLAGCFTDSNIYQLWQRESAQTLLTGTSRLLVKRRGDVVAAAEARLFRLPLTSRGIAYLRWGPLWRRDGATDLHGFRQVVRALRNEYVCRRRMILRLNPRLFRDDDQQCLDILRDEGFAAIADAPTERTLLMDLTPGLDDLRRGFDKKWRNCLSKAERSGLTIEVGPREALFDEFATLYAEMLDRKQFVPTSDIQLHRRIQAVLPPAAKMNVVIARSEGRPCAGAVISALGTTGLYLFGATNDVGMRTSGSYQVQWEVLKLLKDRNVDLYDLHGINPEANPGTYTFKKGLAGKSGREATFAGQLQSFEPSIASHSLLLMERWRRGRRAEPTVAINSEPAESPAPTN